MALTRNAGTAVFSAASPTSISPTRPATIGVGHMLLLTVAAKPSTANAHTTTFATPPAGWTAVTGGELLNAGGYSTTIGADTGNMSVKQFYRVADATDTASGAVAVTLTNTNVAWAQIVGWSSDAGWGLVTPTAVNGSDITGAASWSITGNANLSLRDADWVEAMGVMPTDLPTSVGSGSFTATGVTFGTVANTARTVTANGNQMGVFGSQVRVATGASTAAPVWNMTGAGTTTNLRGPGLMTRLRENIPDARTGLVERFTGSYDATAWNVRNGTVAVSNNQLNYTLANTYPELYGLKWWSLKESDCTVELVNMPATGSTEDFYFQFTFNVNVAGNIHGVIITNPAGGGALRVWARCYVNNVMTDALIGDYDRAAMRFMRLYNSGGNIGVSYSADGHNWTVGFSLAEPTWSGAGTMRQGWFGLMFGSPNGTNSAIYSIDNINAQNKFVALVDADIFVTAVAVTPSSGSTPSAVTLTPAVLSTSAVALSPVTTGQPTYVDTATFNSQTTALTCSVTVPGTVQVGDLCFLFPQVDNNAPTQTWTPSGTGWNTLFAVTAATNITVQGFWRRVQAGDSSTISVTGNNNYSNLTAFWYRNANDPAVIGTVGTRGGVSGASVTAPSITTAAPSTVLTFAGDRSIAAAAGELGNPTFSAGTYRGGSDGVQALSASLGICTCHVADRVLSAGASGTDTATWPDSATNAWAVQVAVTGTGSSPSVVTLTPAVINTSAVNLVETVIVSLTPATISVTAVNTVETVVVALTPAIINLSAVNTIETVIVALTPATIALSGVPGTLALSPVAVTLTPAALGSSAIPVTPAAGASSVTLTPATIASSATTLTFAQGPRLVTINPASVAVSGVAPATLAIGVTLTPAIISTSGRPLIPTPSVTLAPAALIASPSQVIPTPGVTLTPAALVTAAVAGGPVPQPVQTSIAPAVAQFSAVPAAALAVGASSVTLTPAVLATSGISVTPVVQAVARTLTPAVLPISATPMVAVAGPVSLTLTPASVAVSAPPTSPAVGPRTLTLTPAGLTASGVAVGAAPGPTAVSITPAVVASSGVGVVATPGATSVTLTPATFNASAVPATLSLGIVQRTLTPAVVATQAQTLSVATPGSISLIPATMQLSAVALSLTPTVPLVPAVVGSSGAVLVPTIGTTLAPAVILSSGVPVGARPNIDLQPAFVISSARAVTPTPSVTLVAVPVVTAAVPLSLRPTVLLNQASVSAAGVPLGLTVPPMAVTLTPATLNISATLPSNLGGASLVTLNPATINTSAVPLARAAITATISPAVAQLVPVLLARAAVGVTLSAKPLVLTATPVVATPGVLLNPAVVALSGVGATYSLGTVQRTLTPIVLNVSAPALSYAGASLLTLTPATAQVSAAPLGVQILPVLKTLTPAQAAVVARAVTPTLLPVELTVASGNLAITARPLTLQLGSVQRTLTPVEVVVTARPLTFATRKTQSSGWGLLVRQT